MFLKRKVPKSYTYTDYFKWHEHEFTSTPLFCALDVHTKIELSSISHENKLGFLNMDKMCGKRNGKEIEYLWVKENLIVP